MSHNSAERLKQKFGVGDTRARIRSAGSSLKAQFGGPRPASPVRNIGGSSRSLRDVERFKAHRGAKPTRGRGVRTRSSQTNLKTIQFGKLGAAKGKPLANAPKSAGGRAGGGIGKGNITRGRAGGGDSALFGGNGILPAGGSFQTLDSDLQKQRKNLTQRRRR